MRSLLTYSITVDLLVMMSLVVSKMLCLFATRIGHRFKADCIDACWGL